MKYIYRHNGKLRKGTPPDGAEILFVCVGKRVISASKFAAIRSKKHDRKSTLTGDTFAKHLKYKATGEK